MTLSPPLNTFAYASTFCAKHCSIIGIPIAIRKTYRHQVQWKRIVHWYARQFYFAALLHLFQYTLIVCTDRFARCNSTYTGVQDPPVHNVQQGIQILFGKPYLPGMTPAEQELNPRDVRNAVYHTILTSIFPLPFKNQFQQGRDSKINKKRPE
jgi:hypothetical protein